MWSEQFASMLMLMVMASLLRASWELSHQHSLDIGHDTQKAMAEGSNPSAATNPEGTELAPWQKEWAEKAVRRYTESQDKKWRRWNEAMFERSA